MKKMAEITMHLDCGGMVKTYIKCKGESDLLKKLRKSHGNGGWYDFGHVAVNDESVIYVGYKFHGIN